MPFKSSSARNPETPRQSTPAKTPPLLFPRTRTNAPAENAVPISPAPPSETVSRAANNPAPYERAYSTLRELQQKTEPKKQKSEPEPLEPPKPNGGIQLATVPERVQPSEPETKNKETNPSPTPSTVARALLRAVSRLFATPLYIPCSISKLKRFAQFPFRPATVTERCYITTLDMLTRM